VDISSLLDRTDDFLKMGLKRNPSPFRPTSALSLGLLFLPAVLFAGGLLWARQVSPRFRWAYHVETVPLEFWLLLFFGLIATLGGVGDWWYHKVYVTVGPKEHHSHILALGGGSLVFFLMTVASLNTHPERFLVPIQLALWATVTLICYDEFQFHSRRCLPLETALHRMLVFGNGAALLCWMQWLYVP
jgi:hypothetical protein